MKLLVFILILLGVQFGSSIADDGCTQPICCYFGGSLWRGYAYKLNITDFQNDLDRCEIILYGHYSFLVDYHMFTADKNALRMLKDSDKTVYILITYDTEAGWSNGLDPNNKDIDFQLDELVKFSKEYEVDGVVMEDIFMYDPESPFLDQWISSFAAKIKSKMNTLKVGLKITGLNYVLFSNQTAFNYSITETTIDHYIVYMTLSNPCSPETKKESMNPITSSNKNLITLESMCIGIQNSAMNKCKVYAMLQIDVVESQDDANTYDGGSKFSSYSKLCFDSTNGSDVNRWCLDSTSTLYEQAKFVRKYVSGLLLSDLSGDDFDCSCKCQKFPVANAMMSGWDSTELHVCPKIDEIKKQQK